MIPYIIVLCILVYSAFQYDILKRKAENYNNAEKFVLILLIALAGLRNRVGVDTIAYEVFFHNVPNIFNSISGFSDLSDKNMSQPLWYIFNCLVHTFTDEFYWVQIIVAIVNNLLIFRFIRRTTNYHFCSILLFVLISWWNLTFEVVRESICVALYLNSLLELNDKKTGKYFLWNLPAFFIHWFCLPIVLLTLLFRYANSRIIAVFSISMILVPIFVTDYNSLSQGLVYFGQVYAGESASSYIEQYMFGGNGYGVVDLNIFGMCYNLLILSFPIILFFNKQTKESKLDRYILLYVFIFVLYTINPIFSRYLNYLYLVFIVVAVNFLLSNQSNKVFMKLYCYIVLFVFTLGSLYNFYGASQYMNSTSKYDCRHIPYVSIFQDPDPEREAIYGNYGSY